MLLSNNYHAIYFRICIDSDFSVYVFIIEVDLADIFTAFVCGLLLLVDFHTH